MDLNPYRTDVWRTAQRSVIGSLLLDPERYAGAIFQKARREHFQDPALLHIFDAARELWTDNKPVDPVSVLAIAGGEYGETIANCMESTPSPRNCETYLDVLASCARLDTLRTAANEILLAETDKQAAEIFQRMGQRYLETEDVEDLSWAECVSDYLDRMNDKKPLPRLTWGIAQLDNILNVTPGKFVILAADSSVGKTALALQFAYHMATHGQNVGFFSLETDKESLTDRLMAETQVAAVNLPRTKGKDLTERDFRSVATVGKNSGRVSLRLIRKAETVDQIRARTIQRRFDVIYVDYVQLIDGPGRERWDIVTNISIQLHRMAQQLGVTVIGLSQITPPDKTAKRAPSKDDLRESRQLKHDADAILIMSLSQEGSGLIRELQVAKNKDGRLGRMLLNFDAEHMTFSYREPPKQNPYTAAGGKKKNKIYKTPGQQGFEDLPDGEGGPLPF